LGIDYLTFRRIRATKQAKRVMVTFNDFNQFVDLQEYIDLEKGTPDLFSKFSLHA
jgi:hypothetical protein